MHLLLVSDYGLKDEILQKAEAMLDADSICMEDVLKSIYEDKKVIEAEKAKILQNSHEVELLKEKLTQDTTELEEKADKMIEDAKREAKQILLSAKEEASDIIRRLEQTKSASTANKLRNSLNEKIRDNKSGISKLINTMNADSIKIGQSVKVLPLNQIATVLERPNKSGKVFLQVGNSKMYFPVSELGFSEPSQAQKSVNSHKAEISFKSSNISAEINLLGMTVEEAIIRIDKYLDDAYLAGLTHVRIVHGKGTGALRSGIHAYLKHHPHVKSFRLGTFGEGETGVTIVEMK